MAKLCAGIICVQLLMICSQKSKFFKATMIDLLFSRFVTRKYDGNGKVYVYNRAAQNQACQLREILETKLV